MSQLDIYVDSRSRFLAGDTYVLRQMLPGLKKAGVRVRVLDRLDPADTGACAFLHVDLTTVPPPWSWVQRFYERCINGRATTISRERYSRARLARSDAHTGPVIVKTVLNHRGTPELRMAEAQGRVPRAPFWRGRKARRRHSRNLRAALCPPYELFASVDDVPEAAWTDSERMVERFLPGRLEIPVVKHRHEFFLDLQLDTRATFDSLLCDPAKMAKLEYVNGVPPEVRKVRDDLNLDFGSIDFFVVDDEVFVIDANKTTTFTPAWVREHPALSRYVEDVTERLVAFTRGN